MSNIESKKPFFRQKGDHAGSPLLASIYHFIYFSSLRQQQYEIYRHFARMQYGKKHKNFLTQTNLTTMEKEKLQTLLTNFFYKDNLLRFQILIQSDGNTKVYNEYDDYGDYKTAYDHVQLQIIEKNQILFSLKKEPYYSKVA